MTELNAQQVEQLATHSMAGDASAADQLCQHVQELFKNTKLMDELKAFNPNHDPSLPSFALVDTSGRGVTDGSKPIGLEISEGTDRQLINSDGSFGCTYDDKLAPAKLNTVKRDTNAPDYNPKLPTVGK